MKHQLIASFFLFLLIIGVSCNSKQKNIESLNSFSFIKEIRLPGDTAFIYDEISGDISSWWDHSFSKNPYKFYIEAFPGGGFYELFDSLGNGVKHAEVIFAQRGKLLRIDGPLGLSGSAIQIVTSYNFESIGTDSTLLIIEVHASGEIDEGIPEIVEQVWHHFMVERFKPYIESIKEE